MSIANEIERLQVAKSDLATSIASKGVTVPANATLDDYAALVDSIQTSGGGVSMFDEMEDNMYFLVPYSRPFDTNYGFLFNFVNGKTYKVIIKARKLFTEKASLFCYEGNANSPAAAIGSIEVGNTIAEFTYTHAPSNTYTRCGLWVITSAERNSNYSCVVYIKEL
jgi:hypothetical protein